MPELPEVETTVNGLNKKVLKRAFFDVWTDTPKIIRNLSLPEFKKKIKGKIIKKVSRRGKNIIFELSDGYYLLTHLKMTGHYLYDKWTDDPFNKYIRVKFILDNDKVLALSDLRKFAKIILFESKEELDEELSKLGPEPLEKDFTFKKFKERFKNKKGIIKKVLHEQEVMVGVGNIYSDEILWKTKINPFRKTDSLTEKELKDIYTATRVILKKALELGGTSTSDYRDIKGERGNYGKILKVYGKDGEECPRCKTIIERKKINNRSARFCPKCQPLD